MTKADDFVNAEFKQAGERTLSTGGLTKREYFAAMALQGILASSSENTFEKDANWATKAADALIEELNK